MVKICGFREPLFFTPFRIQSGQGASKVAWTLYHNSMLTEENGSPSKRACWGFQF